MMLDADHYADRVEAEACQNPPRPKLTIHIAPLGSKQKLSDPTVDELDSTNLEAQSSVLKRKPRVQPSKKFSKSSLKTPKGQKVQKKGKENSLPVCKSEK